MGVTVRLLIRKIWISPLYVLQNEKFADFKIYDEGKRLHVQSRFEER